MDKNFEMLPLSSDQRRNYEVSTSFPYCNGVYTGLFTRSGSQGHMTGLFTSSCNSCNLRKNHRKREAREEERIREEPERDAMGYTHMELEEIDHYHIPVIMHNLKDYDSHFIIRSITKEVIEKANGAYNNVHMNAINSKSFLSFK